MKIHRQIIHVDTSGFDDIVDLTSYCIEAVRDSSIAEGQLQIFVGHSTCSLTTMEYEPGAIKDLKTWLNNHVPAAARYEHNTLNHDTNAHAHLRSALIGPSISIPIADGRLLLGTWQTPVLIDCDDRPRSRRLVLQVSGL